MSHTFTIYWKLTKSSHFILLYFYDQLVKVKLKSYDCKKIVMVQGR